MFDNDEVREYLNRFGILNSEIEKIIATYPRIADSLYCLHRGKILSPKNQATVCKLSQHARLLAKGLMILFLPGDYPDLYVTQDNFDVLCAHAEHAPSIALILGRLTDADILTPNNRETVCKHAKHAKDIACAFRLLHASRMLVQDDFYFCKKLFNTIYAHAEHTSVIAGTLSFLHATDSLNRDNFDTLLEEPKKAFFTAEKLLKPDVKIKKDILRKNKPYLDFCKIRIAARIIAQGNRGKEELEVEEVARIARGDQDIPQNRFRFFSKLPPELCIKIASFCDDGNLDKDTVEYIAEQTFDKTSAGV